MGDNVEWGNEFCAITHYLQSKKELTQLYLGLFIWLSLYLSSWNQSLDHYDQYLCCIQGIGEVHGLG